MTDLDKNQKINQFSEKSTDSIRSTGNTEYFELREITGKSTMPRLLAILGNRHCICTCGTRLRPSPKNRKLNKDRLDVLSIPEYVIKKQPSQGARHGPTERKRIYYKAHNALREAKKQGHKAILDRFLNDPLH